MARPGRMPGCLAELFDIVVIWQRDARREAGAPFRGREKPGHDGCHARGAETAAAEAGEPAHGLKRHTAGHSLASL
jgi:hypothetical protein